MTLTQLPERRKFGASTKRATTDEAKCELCRDTGYHLDIDVMGKLYAEVCPASCSGPTVETKPVRQARCDVINSLNIDPDRPFRFMEASLVRSGIRHTLLSVVKDFIEDYPAFKKARKKEEISQNPEGKCIVRPVADEHVAALHLFIRNAVFCILGKHERAKLTYVDPVGGVLDVVENRAFPGWGGQINFVISGPVVCTFDQQVFYACLRIHHENGFVGLCLVTNLTAIWKAMGNEGVLYSSSRDAIKRSLSRLVKISVEARCKNGSFWVGGIIDDVTYIEHAGPKFAKVAIKFNQHMVPHYLNGAYTSLKLPLLANLSAYAKRIYEFVMSHAGGERRMSLDKWRSVLGVRCSVADSGFRRRVRDAIEELKDVKLLTAESGISDNHSGAIVYTRLCDSQG